MAFYDNIPEGYSADEEENGLHFFYNREERIKNAPKIVQDFYSGKMEFKRGLFRVLVANRFNRFMLFTVALCLVVVLIANFFGKRPSLATAAGFELEMTSFSYDESVYSQVKIHALKKSLKDKDFVLQLERAVKEGAEVKAVFTFVDADGQESAKIEKRGPIQKNAFFLRTNSPDYDIMNVRASVTVFGQDAELMSNVTKKQ